MEMVSRFFIQAMCLSLASFWLFLPAAVASSAP